MCLFKVIPFLSIVLFVSASVPKARDLYMSRLVIEDDEELIIENISSNWPPIFGRYSLQLKEGVWTGLDAKSADKLESKDISKKSGSYLLVTFEVKLDNFGCNFKVYQALNRGKKMCDSGELNLPKLAVTANIKLRLTNGVSKPAANQETKDVCNVELDEVSFVFPDVNLDDSTCTCCNTVEAPRVKSSLQNKLAAEGEEFLKYYLTKGLDIWSRAEGKNQMEGKCVDVKP